MQTKSTPVCPTRYCKACRRHLLASSFDPKVGGDGKRHGLRPRCRDCQTRHVKRVADCALVNPSRLCQCGCGERVPPDERRTRPNRYVPGHHRRSSPVEYIVQDGGYATPCWVWQRGRDRHGYGMARQDGRQHGAHRVVYERHRGPIPEGLDLDHLCRNPPCVNPDHLEPVTRRVNALRSLRGKLTLDAVRAIRDLDGTVPRKEIAARFGVSVPYVCRIVHRQVWPDDEDDGCGSPSYQSRRERTMATELAALGIATIRGQRVGRRYPDLIVRGTTLVIECEGTWWHDPEDEVMRNAELNAVGLTVLHFTADQIDSDAAECAATVAAWVRPHGSSNR